MVTRLAAALAAAGIATGAAIFWISVVATQGWSYAGYVSESGVAGSPHASGYRLGIAVLSVGLLLLGLSLGRSLPIAAGLVALGGVLASLASAVNCSTGCPLPPYETPTLSDLVHAAASIGAVVACLAAIAVVAIGSTAGVERNLCLALLVVALPLFLLAASSLLLIGRGRLAGDSERLLLGVVTVWSFAMAVLQIRRAAPA